MKKLNRRKFVKSALTGGSALSLFSTAPFVITTKSKAASHQYSKPNNRGDAKKLGVALVGCGGYARGQLAPALQETEHCELRGMVTGTPEKEIVWGDK